MFFTIHRPKFESEKPSEDFSVVQEDAGRIVAIVADGVSRTRIDGEPYPNPSPAALASQAFVRVTARRLVRGELSTNALRQACAGGNDAVFRVNRKLGLWENVDYWTRDLAGTVFAAAAIDLPSRTLWWAYMGDCGLGVLRPYGQKWLTDDLLARVRRHFPSRQACGDERARTIAIRRQCRNRPGEQIKTYGVMTGEETALAPCYLKVGTQSVPVGATVILFSDGFAPWVRNEACVRHSLGAGSDSEVAALLPPEAMTHDEGTLIVIRP